MRLLPQPVRRIGRPVKTSFNHVKQVVSDSVRHHRARRTLIRGLGQYNLTKPVGRCLICYVTPFIGYLYQHPEVGPKGWDPKTLPPIMERLSRRFSSHTMWWESAEIVRQFIERGFVVDYLWPRLEDPVYEDVKQYDVIVDERSYLPAWGSLNSRARKLHYATGSHWIFHNKAELVRHEWLFARRGVAVPTVRQTPPILDPAIADLISSFGNDTNKATFGAYAGKVRKLWLSAVDIPTELIPKDWRKARKHFLWFGAAGWVHKGLDLVTEAFLQEPGLELEVCGVGTGESSFWEVYGSEIKKTKNITLRGWVDPLGKEFQEMVASSCAVVYPSAAEGCSGAIVQCLHHGLVPLVTEISGLEVHEIWPALQGSDDRQLILAIRERCHEVSEMSEKELEEWSRFFWQYAHQNHTRDAYSQSLSKVIDELLA